MEKQKKKYSVYGTAKIGEKGQIVIPKDARKEFGLNPGDVVFIIGGKGKGIGVMKTDFMERIVSKTFSEIMEKEK